ncbi:HCO3 transporter family-domain-containing protein [Mrakia frigida]|uniref:Bor1p n=1 Tax=Mrakia frigida TaxID=29902 RepID=UPI003FCBF5F6
MTSTPTFLPSSATPQGTPSFDLHPSHFDPSSSSQPTPKRSLYQKIGSPGSGIWRDIQGRAPFYLSDWTDAWNYRVLPATAFVFFANVLPGIAFSLDLIETTGKYGVNEVLLATLIAAVAASIFGAQPLVISGVTGPITVLNKTIYEIIEGMGADAPDYLQFIGWVYLWAAIFHWVFALWHGCKLLKYVTRFSCDTFGFYVSWVYLQYGVQILTRQLPLPLSSALLSILLAILTLAVGHALNLASRTAYFSRAVRRFVSDYGMPITIVAVAAVAYWGRLREGLSVDGVEGGGETTLPVGGAWSPQVGRDGWIVKFWELEGKWVGVAFPFGLVLFILFAFDHNVSSVMAQSTDFPLKKPAGFHWDFCLLGITTFISGLLGIPAPNGLIPQAPSHTQALVVMGFPPSSSTSSASPSAEPTLDEGRVQEDSFDRQRGSTSNNQNQNEREENLNEKRDATTFAPQAEVPIAVIEQRVSNLVQGAACAVMMTGPFLKLLGWVPKGVLAGLFWYMGSDALFGSGVTHFLLYLIKDAHYIPATEPLRRVRTSRVYAWVGLELIGFAATFAITNTKAAIGFPVVISLMIPLRTWVVPKLKTFTEEELAILDGPVASPFTMNCL